MQKMQNWRTGSKREEHFEIERSVGSRDSRVYRKEYLAINGNRKERMQVGEKGRQRSRGMNIL